MPLIVDFKKRIGYYSVVFNKKTYKNYFCESNSLCSMIHFRKDENGEKVADLMGFFADVKHAKKCIKSGFFENCGRFCFYAKEMNTDLWEMVRIMTENGIKVTIK